MPKYEFDKVVISNFIYLFILLYIYIFHKWDVLTQNSPTATKVVRDHWSSYLAAVVMKG